MLLPRRYGLLLLATLSAACASGPSQHRGELLTVTELRARQAGATPDSAPAPSPSSASPAPRDTAPPPAARADTAAPRHEGLPSPDVAARAADAAPSARPARRFPRPRWIQVQDPDPPVIPF